MGRFTKKDNWWLALGVVICVLVVYFVALTVQMAFTADTVEGNTGKVEKEMSCDRLHGRDGHGRMIIIWDCKLPDKTRCIISDRNNGLVCNWATTRK